ncbi:MAG TPA: hypothetical protein VG797_11000 [Phycisphaerales bacterium]|nr:hypothetical protein [Phycisphaerales bacterium]
MMNTRMHPVRSAVSLSLAALVAWSVPAFAGDLNPPAGAVVPTMKSLTDVEPRIAINATNTPGDATNLFRITQPGSYYLTGNVNGVSGKSGIQITASGVTLDLGGFALIGVGGTLDGISMSGFRENIVIRNGHVRTWGRHGVTVTMDSGRIENIFAVSNGGWGIDNNSGGTFTTYIVGCEARDNGSAVGLTGGIRAGFTAIVQGCLARNSIGQGFAAVGNCRFENCSSSFSSTDGFNVGVDATLIGCSVNISTGGAGISCGARALIRECSVVSATGDNIVVGASSSVINCVSTSSGTGHGINANGANCTIESCTSSLNSQNGIRTADRALIRGCTTGQNGQDNILLGGAGSSVINCIANGSTSGHGINASFIQCLVQGCTATGNALNGINAAQRTEVIDCVTAGNTQNGIRAAFLGVVRGCFCTGNTVCGILVDAGGGIDILNNHCSENGGSASGAGIRVTSAGCRVDGNTVLSCFRGLDITAGSNVITRNMVKFNTNANNIVGGNDAAPFTSAAAMTSPLGNIQ